jgi:hypothetical protein
MMEINQLLRDRQDDKILYLAALTRTRDQAQLTEITSNIQYGYDGGRHYPFTSILDIFVPENQVDRASPWDLEAETWRRITEELLLKRELGDLRQWCAKRRAYVESGRVHGLSEKLFLPDMSGGELRLRKGFAFWPRLKYEDGLYSQSDVYFSIAAILHNWRYTRGLRQGEAARRTLLSPRTFFRFNDGLIQSCLLRSCRFFELDYRSSSDLSIAMAEVLSVVFAHYQDNQGEAVLEFLLALEEHRLSVQKEMLTGPLVEFEEVLSNSSELNAKLAKVLIARILEDLGRN